MLKCELSGQNNIPPHICFIILSLSPSLSLSISFSLFLTSVPASVGPAPLSFILFSMSDEVVLGPLTDARRMLQKIATNKDAKKGRTFNDVMPLDREPHIILKFLLINTSEMGDVYWKPVRVYSERSLEKVKKFLFVYDICKNC